MNLTALIPVQYRILAVLLLIAACIGFGYVEGISREADHRDAQALKQKQADEQAFQRVLVYGKQHAAAVIEWQTAATIYYHNWQERLNHENDTQLAECTVAQGTQGQAGIHDMRLSATWLGLYNAAWLPELAGQSDPGGAAYALFEAGTVTPREVLGNVSINAQLCTTDRKRLDELIDFLGEIKTPSSSPLSGGERSSSSPDKGRLGGVR